MNELSIHSREDLSEAQIAYIRTTLMASFDVEDVESDAETIRVKFEDASLEDKIRASARRAVFIAKSIDLDLLFEVKGTGGFVSDPQPDLEKSRDVIPVHPGFFTLQGGFLKVFHGVNRKIRQFAAELDAIEQEYPAVWPVRLFKSIDYFHDFPQQVILCATVKDDYRSRESFASRYSKDQSFSSVPMDELMGDAHYGLEPAVCDCCYYGLEGLHDLHDSHYTCYNKVFRNELSPTHGLDRLTNFSVRDIMFVGAESFVLEARQRLIEVLSEFLTNLQISAKIETANDPFFAGDAAMKAVFQNSHRLKYELLADIPHLQRPIAVGSINYHVDFFGKAFDIQSPAGSVVHSGCIGVGMERMTYALYCQHGPDLRQWPREVFEYLDVDV